MIIHASLKTDIAYFYTEWLINRLRDGNFYIPTEKPNVIERYNIKDNCLDKLFLHTKNPYKLISKSNIFKLHPVEIVTYFTMYDKFYEPKIKERDKIFQYVRKISATYGKENTSIGYDHIFKTIINNAEWHINQFEFLCRILHNAAECIYIDFSINGLCLKNESFLGEKFSDEEERHLREEFQKIAGKYNMKLKNKLDAKNLSENEIDIGDINTCPAMCRHCEYITNSKTALLKKGMHNPHSGLLIGNIGDNVKIKKMVSSQKKNDNQEMLQTSMFDFFVQ